MNENEGGSKLGRMRIGRPDDRWMGTAGRFVVTVLLLAAMALVTGFFAARTDGGRKVVTDWLEARVGMDFTAGRTRIGWPYALVIENVRSAAAATNGAPCLAAREVRIGWGGGRRWAVSVRRCEAVLAEGADGLWQPAFLARLGATDPSDLASLSRLTGDFRDRLTLRVDDASVRWLGPDGAPRAWARGAGFRMVPLRAPGRRLYHGRFTARSLGTAGGAALNDVRREWICGDGVADMEILPAGGTGRPDPRGQPEPGGGRAGEEGKSSA